MNWAMKYHKVGLLAITLIFSSLIQGCDKKVETNACANPEALRKLRLDFGYELASNSSLPQVEYSNIRIQKEQNTVVYCHARAGIEGNSENIIKVLIAKIGAKNFKSIESSLTSLEPQNFSEEKFNQLYPYLATFYLKRYCRTLPRSKNYEIALFVDYTVNKTNYHISGINYDRDLFYEAFHLMAKDLKPSENDTRAISILNR